MSGESTTGSINPPANPHLEFVDADELAKRYKLQHIERIHRKVQESNWLMGEHATRNHTEHTQYQIHLWRFAVELAPLIEDALDRGLIEEADIMLAPESDAESNVLDYARYQEFHDDYLLENPDRAFLLLYQRLVRLEHRMRLGFTFEDDAQGELFIDELNGEE
jgi:hypothetical protein